MGGRSDLRPLHALPAGVQKNRPRIPTPDVTAMRGGDANGSAPSTPGTPSMLQPQPTYPTEMPVVQVRPTGRPPFVVAAAAPRAAEQQYWT